MKYCRDDREPQNSGGECARYGGGSATRKTCRGGDCGAASPCMICPGADNVKGPGKGGQATFDPRNKLKLTETELTKLIEKVIKEQLLPIHIRKGSEEHADWIRSQREKHGDDEANDEILESLLTISQRLEMFVKETREDGIPMEDLRDIQKDVEYHIIQYLGATEGRG